MVWKNTPNLSDSTPSSLCSESLGRLIGPSLGRLSASPFSQVIDLPRMFPARDGGTPRSWGYGGFQPPSSKSISRAQVHCTIPPALFKKTPGRGLRFPENLRIGCWGFQKMIGSRAGNSKKSPMRLVQIVKKERICCWEFRKKSGSRAEDSQKTSAPPGPLVCPTHE